jgi:hypothetical protein
MTRSGDLRYVLAVRPAEFTRWSREFLKACELLAENNVASARAALLRFDGVAVTHWYHFVAQNAGRDRVVLLGTSNQARVTLAKQARARDRMPAPEETRLIHQRDRYRCRYCQSPVLPPATLHLVSDLVGIDLRKQRTNLETHGVQWLHCATTDHVESHASGGSSDANNAVTSCKACQFGKGKYSLKQLRITLRGPAPEMRLKGTPWSSIVLRLGELKP